MKKLTFWLLATSLFWAFLPRPVFAATISNVRVTTGTPKVYEKYEVFFDIGTNASNPFFVYDTNPPTGVTSGIGISVEGIITSPSGKVLHQPAFYMTDVQKNGSGAGTYYVETNQSHWALRFSPLETGQYHVTLSATDVSGTTTADAGNFTAAATTKPGFIKVSQQDSRYFEFSNGTLYWPIGPAWGNSNDYSKYVGTGENLERNWMGGKGVYSTNWARWISSAEQQGNEGFMTPLNWKEHAPGSELSYQLYYPNPVTTPNGFHIWIGNWNMSDLAQKLKPSTTYQIHFVAKTANLAGPRVSGQPYGLVVKVHCGGSFDWPTNFTDPTTTDNQYRNCPQIVPEISANQNWFTVDRQFTTSSPTYNDISIYLDNVTDGQAYIDTFSMKEVLSGGTLGGELIRGPRADLHTYVDQRGAAYFDYQLSQGEQNGVYFKYVVMDKNDWVPNHLTSTGNFADIGGGYYQPEGTKERWLLKQWWRYLNARWGYSTAIQSWELNNEGDPNDTSHWATAQAFAQYMHQNDAQPHLATTSFWCCWEPTFWKNPTTYPDIDYADIHEYTGKHEVTGVNLSNDLAGWTITASNITAQSHIGKPVMRGETGITAEGGWDPIPDLKTANPGLWYHDLLWGELNEGGMSDPNYWFSDHINVVTGGIENISKPFYNFIKNIPLNSGGYQALSGTIVGSNIRVVGQRNLSSSAAHVWIQNQNHSWSNPTPAAVSGSVTVGGFTPNAQHIIETWDTYAGTKTTSTINASGNGSIVLPVNNLTTDIAYKIWNPNLVGPPPSITPSPTPIPGDFNGDKVVDYRDWLTFIPNFNQNNSTYKFIGTGLVNLFDFNKLVGLLFK